MKAMILAAGRGERLRPLTDHTPKPLLQVAGKPIIQHTIESLVKAGFSELVINLAYLGEQIESTLGDGSRFNAQLQYSYEGETGLETAGGIIHALPLLGEGPFLVVNGDIVTDYPYQNLITRSIKLAHLVLVPNPAHHQCGDFALCGDSVCSDGDPFYTFSGVGLYRAEMFFDREPGRHPLAPILREAMMNTQVSGEIHEGFWMDMGTVERLRLADEKLLLGSE